MAAKKPKSSKPTQAIDKSPNLASDDNRGRIVRRFPEAQGKIVKSIEVYVTADHYSININFDDNTAIVLPVEASVILSPFYGDWTTGDQKVIKEYEPVKSISLDL
jgi:hypothetical protein